MNRIYTFIIFAFGTFPAIALQKNTTDSIPKVYAYIEVMPQFPGNLSQFLKDNVRYPDSAREINACGKVIINFRIDTLGIVDSPNIAKGAHPILNREALRVVRSMPPWIPGRQNGKLVRVYYTLPIAFVLEDESFPYTIEDSLYNARQRFVKDSLANNYSASYPGNWERFITTNIHYPNEARKKGIKGTVRIEFLVEASGVVSKIIIDESAHPLLDVEAMKLAAKMAKKRWIPGKINGIEASYRMVLPFAFPSFYY